MDEDQLRRFRRYSRVFPAAPYARHTPRVGCSVATDALPGFGGGIAVPHTAAKGSAVKVLALLCSKSHGCTSSDRGVSRSGGAPSSSPSPSTPTPPAPLPSSKATSRKRPRGDAEEATEAPAQTHLDGVASAPADSPASATPLKTEPCPSLDAPAAPSPRSDPPAPAATRAEAPVKREALEEESCGDADGVPAVGEASSTRSDAASAATPTASLYVRVQYDKALITTLPVEVMRTQHPQVLIDYLLSMSVWA